MRHRSPAVVMDHIDVCVQIKDLPRAAGGAREQELVEPRSAGRRQRLHVATHLLECGSEGLLVQEVCTLAHRMNECAVNICKGHKAGDTM